METKEKRKEKSIKYISLCPAYYQAFARILTKSRSDLMKEFNLTYTKYNQLFQLHQKKRKAFRFKTPPLPNKYVIFRREANFHLVLTDKNGYPILFKWPSEADRFLRDRCTCEEEYEDILDEYEDGTLMVDRVKREMLVEPMPVVCDF